MESFLKTWEVDTKTLGKVTLTELSYGAQMEIHQSLQDESHLEGAITMKYGLGLEGTVAEVGYLYSMEQVQEVTAFLTDAMGLAEDEVKNSESTPTEDSVLP